jgi:hypothetical protein
MEENVNVVEPAAQAPEPVVTDVGQQADSASEQAAPAPAAPPAERMIPQSQVSKIAAREAREAAEKARSDERTRMEREYAQRNAPQPPPGAGQQQQNLGGIQQHSEEDIRRMIQQEAWKLSQMEVASQIERDWLSTMDAEKQRDPEFADLYDALNIEQHGDLVLWMSGMDNKASVIRDMAKNPSKFAQVLMLKHSGSPELAKRELNKLSASIKANEDANKQAHADAPLSQIKPSNIGSDNGEMSVKDYMSQPWLRG